MPAPSIIAITKIRRVRVQTTGNQPLEANTRPNHPQAALPSARPHQFSQKSCKSPGNALHCSLQPSFTPAAPPQLDTLRPMKTVCPSCTPPPTTPPPSTPRPPPHALPGLAASVRCPQYTRNRFSVRPGSSQIVSDRLRSSEIVRAHRRPSPAVPAELPQCSPDSVRQSGKKSVIPRHFASKYDPTRPGQKTVPDLPRPYRYSTNLKRPNRHADRHEMAVNDRQERRAIRDKKLFFRVTLDDIWGHWGTYVPLARPARPGNALPGAPRKSAPGSVPLHATEHARKQAKNGEQRPPHRDRASARKDFLSVDISRLWSTLVDFCRLLSTQTPCTRAQRNARRLSYPPRPPEQYHAP